jgi:5-methylcytosine-specific restriction enzyme B
VAAPQLQGSEPLRFRNQGTLFALTPTEAEFVLSWLAERDPSLPDLRPEEADEVGQLTRVTFHPSYTYEDFIEGFRPVPSSGGGLQLRLEDGVFKRVCGAALAAPERPYLVVIDEINRGNIPRIFGELITLLEADKRGLTILLPQSHEAFAVPSNVFIIGTMNTADRSIRLLDAALRRRFAFLEFMPDPVPLEGGRVAGLDLAGFLTELNRRIARVEGREKQIGHSFLLDGEQPIADPALFAARFRTEILPLLQEYAYDDYRELATYLGPAFVSVDEQRLNGDVLADPDSLVAALVEEFQPRVSDSLEVDVP